MLVIKLLYNESKNKKAYEYQNYTLCTVQGERYFPGSMGAKGN
jgi:hypothetical protein